MFKLFRDLERGRYGEEEEIGRAASDELGVVDPDCVKGEF